MSNHRITPTSYKSNAFTSRINEHPQVQQWIGRISSELNVAFCFRWTNACIAQRRLYDDASFSRDFGYFWNSVDRMLFGDDWKTKKLERLTTLERTDGTSWHAHGLCSADKYTVDKMRFMLTEKWQKHIGVAGSNAHTHKHLVYIEENKGNYGDYILKHIDSKEHAYGRVGVIDAQNTFLG